MWKKMAVISCSIEENIEEAFQKQRIIERFGRNLITQQAILEPS